MGEISFTKTRRVTALVDETIQYTVDDDRVREVMADSEYGLSQVDAIAFLLGTGECKTESYTAEVDEVVMVHDSEIIAD